MQIHPMVLPDRAETMSTAELRKQFHVGGLFQSGAVSLRWWEVDRTVLGAAVPLDQPLALTDPDELRAAFMFERREAGVINLGGAGTITTDGAVHALDRGDALYIGCGTRTVSFASNDASMPARFFLLSYPAHAIHPTKRIAVRDVEPLHLGSRDNANERALYKLIHPGTVATCQVVLGYTRMAAGSIWNTMPPHTHLRRSEVYLYFDVQADQRVFHFMGRPDATRHLVVANEEAVLSPPWSIHSGAGTASYAFVWGMGGENQEFSDMDAAPIRELR